MSPHLPGDTIVPTLCAMCGPVLCCGIQGIVRDSRFVGVEARLLPGETQPAMLVYSAGWVILEPILRWEHRKVDH